MKGIIFTLDVLIGLMIVLLLLTLYPFKSETSYPEISFQSLSYVANDILDLLSTLKVKEVRSYPTISNLLEKGILKKEDLEKSVLDLIGSFWYAGNESIARNITRELLENLTQGVCVNLSTNNGVIYSSCNLTSPPIATSSTLLSGYEVGKPSSGYVARAWAKKVVKNSTLIIPFFPEGSGWSGKNLTITKKFNLSQMKILDATLYLSFHYGGPSDEVRVEELRVNDNLISNDKIQWLYKSEVTSVFWGVTTAVFGKVNITEEIHPGFNEIKLVLDGSNYHSHTHPGMRLVITYRVNQTIEQKSKKIVKRYYFDDVEGRTGSWATLSFFIPPSAKNVSAKLHLKGLSVDDTMDRYWWFGWHVRNATDVKIYINSDTPFFEDGVSDSHDFIAGVMNPEYTFNITDQLINGTNVVSVYFNCYGDSHWGNESSRIYSDPLSDPNGSSYVEVSYELETSPLKYGEVDITVEELFGGTDSNPKTYDFNISEGREDIRESFIHVAQGFSSMLEAYAWYDNEARSLVFESPSVRAVPENVYVNPSIWKVGENHIELRDVQPSGSLSPANTFLPWSSFEYTYIIKAIVGYGDVFNSSQAAIDDAIQRLQTQIGEGGINATEIEVDSKSIYGIEWLWGPATFKVSVWKK